MHSLELSPVTNQLSAYLQNNSPFQFSQPLRTINTEQQLEIQFNGLKQRHSIRMHELQRRLELCLGVHRSTEERLDFSRSRIKVERSSLSMERYGDLLEHNFREVTWTKTSRVKVDSQNKERNSSIKGLEQGIDAFQNELFQSESRQEEILRQLQSTIQNEFDSLEETVNSKSQQMVNTCNSFENRLSQLHIQLSQDLTDIQCHLSNTSLDLLALIDNSLNQINMQLPQS